MARHQSNPKKVRIFIAVSGGFLLAAGLAAFFLFRPQSAFANLPAFPVSTYMNGRNLLSQEDYKVEGRVDNVLLRSADGERLLVVIQPDGSELRLPLIVEKKGGKVSIQREQHLRLKVNLGSASQIQCTQYEPK